MGPHQGIKLSLGFVKSALKAHGLVSRTVKTYKRKSKAHKSFKNKLDRQFNVSENTKEQPRIVGYKVALSCDASLVVEVIDQVNINFSSDRILFHSDQGSQFTSKEVVNKIEANHWVQSMSRKGNCWDNAVIESFFSILKREELKWHTCHSLVQAERIVREYIEEYYMLVRPHTSLGGIPPIQYILNKNLSTKTQK